MSDRPLVQTDSRCDSVSLQRQIPVLQAKIDELTEQNPPRNIATRHHISEIPALNLSQSELSNATNEFSTEKWHVRILLIQAEFRNQHLLLDVVNEAAARYLETHGVFGTMMLPSKRQMQSSRKTTNFQGRNRLMSSSVPSSVVIGLACLFPTDQRS